MSIISQSPNLSLQQACRIARDTYGLDVTADPLPGERDQNFRLRADDGRSFVLKIANAGEDRSFLEAQNQTMLRLEERDVGYCPALILTCTGNEFFEMTSSGSTFTGRLITWQSGDVLANCRWQGPELLRHLGVCVGRVDDALQGFDHPALHRGDFPWDLRNALDVINRHADQIKDCGMRRTVDEVRELFITYVVPHLSQLSLSVIHNDANDHNVIVQGTIGTQQIAGLIDFGDMVHSYTVAGLAIAVAYAMLDAPDPLEAAAYIVEGYHDVAPLGDEELAVIFPMACGRLAVSVCMAASQQQQRHSTVGVCCRVPLKAS